MHESDHGKLASPADGQRDSTDGCQQLVAAALAAVETLVGAVPYTLDRVSAFWFAQNLVKADLGTEERENKIEKNGQLWRLRNKFILIHTVTITLLFTMFIIWLRADHAGAEIPKSFFVSCLSFFN